MPEPLCRYYGTCGGCTLQHLEPEAYERFKRGILLACIERLGCDPALVGELVTIGPRSRRRVEFKVAVHKGTVELGFYAAKSHDMVAIDDCPVTQAELTALIAPLRDIIASLKKPGIITAVQLTLVSEGIDLALITRKPLPAADKQALIDFCRARSAPAPILRLSECERHDRGENASASVIFDTGKVSVTFSKIDVALPLQPFLQATIAGEHALTQQVLKHSKAHTHIADLYSGCGTYSFPLAQRGQHVAAYEGNAEMVSTVHNAAKQYGLEAHLRAEVRDLVKRPLSTAELAPFDAVIINPPRNGASPQVKQLAKSTVKAVIMVSCNPTTFERDARYLLDAGYQLTAATPIDQFTQTRHLELVAAFTLKSTITPRIQK